MPAPTAPPVTAVDAIGCFAIVYPTSLRNLSPKSVLSLIASIAASLPSLPAAL